MTEKTVEQLIEDIVTLPTIPAALANLNNAIENPESSAADIADVVSTDQSVATKVLRIANSTFYGLRTRVSSLQQSVAILGTRVIRNLVLQATTIQAYTHLRDNRDFDLDDFWQHSILAGMSAQILSKHVRTLPVKADEVYAIGLVHDIGRVVLLDCQTEKFIEAVKLSARVGVTSAAAENEVFGFDHTMVGEMLAKRWKLPDEVAQGIRLHHSPPEGGDPMKLMGCLISVADHLAHNIREKGLANAAAGLDQTALNLLGIAVELTPATITSIAEEIHSKSSSIEV